MLCTVLETQVENIEHDTEKRWFDFSPKTFFIFKSLSEVVANMRIFRDIGFFREFWSESHRILFLGQLVCVFSVRNSFLIITILMLNQTFDKTRSFFFVVVVEKQLLRERFKVALKAGCRIATL